MRRRALELLTGHREYREDAERRVTQCESEVLQGRHCISELEGRVSELQRQLREERMRSDMLLKEDLDGPNYKKREKSYLKSKLREVVAVHEVLQWQMHEKDKEMRALEDIIKAHLLIHPGPSKPLRLLLARRLPAFLDRVQRGLPIAAEIGRLEEGGAA